MSTLQEEPMINDFGKKKKRKPKSIIKSIIKPPNPDKQEDSFGFEDIPVLYTYDQLLSQIPFKESKKVVILPIPEVIFSNRKTTFCNFIVFVKIFRRSPSMVMSHITKEFGTTVTINKDNRLIIKGRFREAHVESVLKSFVQEFVRCAECKMIDTSLIKDNRVTKLTCHSCGASRTVITT